MFIINFIGIIGIYAFIKCWEYLNACERKEREADGWC